MTVQTAVQSITARHGWFPLTTYCAEQGQRLQASWPDLYNACTQGTEVVIMVGFPVIQWAYDLVKTRQADMKPSRSWGVRWGIIEYMGTQGKPNMENKVIWVDASSHFRRIMHSCGFIPMWAWSLPVHRSAHHCERCLNHVDAYYNKYRRNVCKHCVTVINFQCQTFSLINFQNASKLEKSADDRSSLWLLTK